MLPAQIFGGLGIAALLGHCCQRLLLSSQPFSLGARSILCGALFGSAVVQHSALYDVVRFFQGIKRGGK